MSPMTRALELGNPEGASPGRTTPVRGEIPPHHAAREPMGHTRRTHAGLRAAEAPGWGTRGFTV
jgi:hypothetical protein